MKDIMTGQERIRKAMRREATDRVPWVPFVGVHGGYLLGIAADEYLKNSEAIARGVGKAIELYQPDGIPVVFDLQVEAEALGCKVQWSKDNPPAVISHPLAEGKSPKDLPELDAGSGRIPVCLEATRRLRETYPEHALYGLITGPFTLALHLAGTNIFMQMMEAPNEVNALLEFCHDITCKMAGWYMDAGCDVIAVVDPMTSQIDPASFEQFVFPPVTRLFEMIRNRDRLSSFFVCGYAQQNIPAMCACRPDNISIDENIPLEYVRKVAEKHGISFGGNLKLTSVLSMGTPGEVEIHALETLEEGGDVGFIMAPGCDLVMGTPPENLQAVTRILADPYHREFVKTVRSAKVEEEVPDLTDHWNADKVVIDIITLDSSSCAPCQYMVEAMELAARPYGDKAECNEYSIKTREGLQMMSALGVKNVPVTVMDGEILFVSQIPPARNIEKAIQKKLRDKKLL